MIELKAPVKAAVDYSLTSRSRHTNRKKQHHRLKSARPQEGICYIVAGKLLATAVLHSMKRRTFVIFSK